MSLETAISSTLSSGEFSIPVIGLVFVAGLLTSTTPCVYPMIPITAGVFGGQSPSSQSRSNPSQTHKFKFELMGPFIYVAGLAIVYGSLGVFAATSGLMFGQISSHPLIYIAMANLCFLFAFWMIGWLRMPHFEVGQTLFDKFSHPSLRLFFMGAAAGLVAAPCTAPVLGILLMYIASTGDVLYGGTLMIVFAYGLGALLILVGMFSHWLARLPKSGSWMNASKYFFFLVMFISGQYFLIEAGKLLF